MRWVVTTLMTCGTILVLACVAIGVLISVESGRTNWLLIAVFALDSLALVMIAGWALCRHFSIQTVEAGGER